ncbi:glycoside hydrolase superfamily, partial [Gongronella butleri]
MKLSIASIGVLAGVAWQGVSATLGADVSVATSQDTFSCLIGQGLTQFVARAYMEAWGRDPGGAIDSGAVTSYNNAYAAGANNVDVYMFPCTGRSTCKSASTQVGELAQLFSDNGMAHVGTVWLDVEVDSSADNWPDAGSNQATLGEFKAALDDSGLKWGIYSSASQWEAITGSTSWELDSSKPLWYAHYDDSQSFSDFSPFGGWTSPSVKQYAGDTTLCGVGVDLNYYG